MTGRQRDGWDRIDVDLSTFDRVNLHPRSDGQLAIRPGLRRLHSAAAASKYIACRSIKHPYTQEVWHYVVDYSTTDGTVIRIFDDDFTEVQAYDTGSDAEPPAASINAFLGQVCITAPTFEMAWGLMGDTLTRATPKASVNELNTPAIPIPIGISTSWASRLVVGSGAGVFFSDPLEPRTFVGFNVVSGDWGSEVYGLHVSAQGALIVVTDAGVYAIPEDAASSGQIVLGNWSKLTDFRALDYNDTAISRGEVWGVTQRGLRRLVPEGPELRISEQQMSRYHGPRVHHRDYRAGRIVGAQEGPMVSIGDRLLVLDVGQGHRSWWDSPNTTLEAVGVLQDSRGADMLCTEDAVFAITGNFDGTEDATSGEFGTAVVGGYAGRAPLSAGVTVDVREVRFAADGVANVQAIVRGRQKTAAPNRNGLIIGTAAWNSGDNYFEPDLEPVLTYHDQRCQELTLELATEKPLTRVGADVDVRGVVLGRAFS